MRRIIRLGMLTIGACALGLVVLVGVARAAAAQNLGSRPLARGSQGPDVAEMQMRVTGWYGNCVAGVPCSDHFHYDGIFGPKTERAVKNFEKAYGLPVDGRVDGPDFNRLFALQDPDQSTKHFAWGEFTEKSASCSTGNAGTFNGGYVAAHHAQQYVRHLMYRLEAVRHKMDGQHPIYVTSGFRSRAYQQCLKQKNGGNTVASHSQHSYGTAFDGFMSGINLGRQRGLAKTSELHAIFCYGSSKHNHLDIRLDNGTNNGGGRFVWPRTDPSGRDLDVNGKTCYGGHKSPPSTGVKPPAEGLPLPDPWGVAEDPSAPTAAEGQALSAASEETWLLEDHDNPTEIVGAVVDSVPEQHHPFG